MQVEVAHSSMNRFLSFWWFSEALVRRLQNQRVDPSGGAEVMSEAVKALCSVHGVTQCRADLVPFLVINFFFLVCACANLHKQARD